MARTGRYHHGDLAAALIHSAVQALSEAGPSKLSLRDVARRAGVSHGAPAHHFGDKAGLLTAVAVEGFGLFLRAIVTARDTAGDDAMARWAATGRAYVLFAADHRPYFEIMFRPELIRHDDPALVAAKEKTLGVLAEVIEVANKDESPVRRETLAVSSWATAHGLAVLWLEGNLGDQTDRAELESLLDRLFPA